MYHAHSPLSRDVEANKMLLDMLHHGFLPHGPQLQGPLSIGMKILAATTRPAYASCQHSVKGSFCLPRPYFSPPHTHQTKFVFLEALRSVSRQDSWRAVCGTRDKPWPGTTVWAFPINHGRGSSLGRFSKCKAAR